MGSPHLAELIKNIECKQERERRSDAVTDKGSFIGDCDVAEVVWSLTHSSAYIIKIVHNHKAQIYINI
jgi:hypothetical protein